MAGSASSYTDEGDGNPISEINVTPLVDIVLVLLIVFMVTMPTIVIADKMNERKLDLRLPDASQAKSLTTTSRDFTVEVRASGEYVVGTQARSRTELSEDILQAANNNPGMSVGIRADRDCPWEYVIAIMEMCAGLDIECRASVVKQ